MSENCPEGGQTKVLDICLDNLLSIWSMLLFGDLVQCLPITKVQIANLATRLRNRIRLISEKLDPFVKIDGLTRIDKLTNSSTSPKLKAKFPFFSRSLKKEGFFLQAHCYASLSLSLSFRLLVIFLSLSLSLALFSSYLFHTHRLQGCP